MKKVLVLGAGLVAGPLVKYLLDQPDFAVTVADVEAGRAAKLVSRPSRGETAEVLSIEDRAALTPGIGRADLVVSMVPYTFHPRRRGSWPSSRAGPWSPPPMSARP